MSCFNLYGVLPQEYVPSNQQSGMMPGPSRMGESPAQISQSPNYSPEQSLMDRVGSPSELFSSLLLEMEQVKTQSIDLWQKFSEQSDNSIATASATANNSSDNKYVDVISKKSNFVDHLTKAVLASSPIDVPKHKIDCYQKFALVEQQKLVEAQIIDKQLKEEIKDRRKEIELLDSQINTFAKLLQEQDAEEEFNESQQLNQQLKAAKTDMNYVLEKLYPEETVIEVREIMAEIHEAYLENKDNVEAQYIEISGKSYRNKALLCLIKANVIIPHPKNPLMFRLLSDD